MSSMQTGLLLQILEQLKIQSHLQMQANGYLVDILATTMPENERDAFCVAQAKLIAKICGFTAEDVEAAVKESDDKS